MYAYVSNNPLTHFDAYGLFEEDSQPSEDTTKVDIPANADNQNNAFDHIKDFGAGLVSGFWDPISTGHDFYTGSYQDKSIGRMAGETIGALANLNPAGIVKCGAHQATKMSLPFALKAFNWFRGAANVRVMKNMVQVGKVAAASEKVVQTSDRVHSIASNISLSTTPLLKNIKKMDASLELAKELKFAVMPLARMKDQARYVPRHILAEAILNGKKYLIQGILTE